MVSYLQLMKSTYDDDILAVDDLFDQWDPSIATPMEEIYGPEGRLY